MILEFHMSINVFSFEEYEALKNQLMLCSNHGPKYDEYNQSPLLGFYYCFDSLHHGLKKCEKRTKP